MLYVQFLFLPMHCFSLGMNNTKAEMSRMFDISSTSSHVFLFSLRITNMTSSSHGQKDGVIYVKNLPYGVSLRALKKWVKALAIEEPSFIHLFRTTQSPGQEHTSGYFHFKYRTQSQLDCWAQQLNGKEFPGSTKALYAEVVVDEWQHKRKASQQHFLAWCQWFFMLWVYTLWICSFLVVQLQTWCSWDKCKKICLPCFGVDDCGFEAQRSHAKQMMHIFCAICNAQELWGRFHGASAASWHCMFQRWIVVFCIAARLDIYCCS